LDVGRNRDGNSSRTEVKVLHQTNGLRERSYKWLLIPSLTYSKKFTSKESDFCAVGNVIGRVGGIPSVNDFSGFLSREDGTLPSDGLESTDLPHSGGGGTGDGRNVDVQGTSCSSIDDGGADNCKSSEDGCELHDIRRELVSRADSKLYWVRALEFFGTIERCFYTHSRLPSRRFWNFVLTKMS
jgi:hypothetical protein